MTTFRVALPGNDLNRGKAVEMAVDARYANPKIDTQSNPPHAGILYLNWSSTAGIAAGTLRTIYSFPHGYNSIPTAFATYKFDNGANILKGTLPFQFGALGVIIIDTDDKNVNIKYVSTDQTPSPLAIGPFTMQIRFYVMAEHGY